jgi:hypothetical protein
MRRAVLCGGPETWLGFTGFDVVDVARPVEGLPGLPPDH